MFASASIAATGSFCLGACIGWMSNMQPKIEGGDLGYSVSDSDISWISSAMTLGAALVCIPIGLLMNFIGRKFAMIFALIPTIIGWILVCIGKFLFMTIGGRFLLGMGLGSFCVTAPVYTTEVAELKYRGMLGTLFQLMITLGILYGYVIGCFIDNFFWASAIMGIPSGVLLIFLFFVPFSPVFLLSKGKTERAKNELQKLRGKSSDVGEELRAMDDVLKKLKDAQRPLCKTLCTKTPLKALMIGIALMFAQQFGGINAFVFYSTKIFEDAKSDLEAKYVTLVLGVVMFLATIISVFVVDLVGRKILLVISAATEAVTCLCAGFFFYLKDRGDNIDNITWLPVTAVLLYIIGFSIGLGPIPWLIMAELFEEDIKFFACSIVGTSNWVMAFIVTFGFAPLVAFIGKFAVFWIFTIVNILCIVFTLLCVPETRKKTIDEIQALMNAKIQTPLL